MFYDPTEITPLAPALELRHISKRFAQTRANVDISLQVESGSIHGIIGENGSGKSTLMNIIYGLYAADSGSILVDGALTDIDGTQTAIKAGIGMVHQQVMLVENFSVLENVILGLDPGEDERGRLSTARAELLRLQQEYGLAVDLDTPVADLPVGLQQQVEILKALYRGARILILDEPTGVLTPQESRHLFKILSALKSQGMTLLFISHKLREILAVTDRVSVMRQGRMLFHVDTRSTSQEQLAEYMVGRKVRLNVDKQPPRVGDALLKVNHLHLNRGVSRPLNDVSFSVHAGEVVGIAGVSGNGQSQLLEVLAGIRGFDQGELFVNGHRLTPKTSSSPVTFRKLGIGHVPESRLKKGIVGRMSAAETAILGYHRGERYNRGLLQDRKRILEDCQQKMKRWDVRPGLPEMKSGLFSGGNQQKLVIAREVEQEPSILLIGQPTRGVDIGAIELIHQKLSTCATPAGRFCWSP